MSDLEGEAVGPFPGAAAGQHESTTRPVPGATRSRLPKCFLRTAYSPSAAALPSLVIIREPLRSDRKKTVADIRAHPIRPEIRLGPDHPSLDGAGTSRPTPAICSRRIPAAPVS